MATSRCRPSGKILVIGHWSVEATASSCLYVAMPMGIQEN